MQMTDQFGNRLTTTDSAAISHYDRSLWNLLTLSHDPAADVAEAVKADPGFIMGHCLGGTMLLLGTEKSMLPAAREAIEAASAAASKGVTEQERGHIAALRAFADGSIARAADHWEHVLIDYPEDVLAMSAAHQCDFFIAQSSELRDRVARRLGRLDPGWKGYGFYLGMHAFGLEEMNQYEAAEDAGRQAVAACPRDTWAIHAVAHVMEMTARIDDGVRWLEERTDDWAKDNFFQVHNWWHLALYLFDRERWSDVLALYDGKLRGGQSAAMLDVIDASALLWRLTIHGRDVGDRWSALARLWEPRIEDGWYTFNDTHAMLAFAAADRPLERDRLLAVMERTAQTETGNGRAETGNGRATRLVGLPVAKAVIAFTQGRYGEAVDLLLPLRLLAPLAGGSHAQRDLISQTLIRAAELDGQRNLALALLSERCTQKPQSQLARLWQQRAAAASSSRAQTMTLHS